MLIAIYFSATLDQNLLSFLDLPHLHPRQAQFFPFLFIK